jgi:hypothetical protein
MAEEKYKAIYDSLKEECEKTIESKNNNQFVDEFRTAVKDRVKLIHDDLDVKKSEIIKLALEAYAKKQGEDDGGKIVVKDDKKNKAVEYDPNSFRGKIEKLIGSLQKVTQRTESLDETIRLFGDEKKLDKVLSIKGNDFVFKDEKKLHKIIEGKGSWDLGWLTPQNKPGNSNTNSGDENILDVHSNSCYNYFQTDKPIDNECDYELTFETNIKKSDGYLYFGVMGDGLDKNGKCMCCTIAQVTYIKSDGKIVVGGSSTDNCSNFYTKDVNTITMRILGSERKVYFNVNDEEEKGPFKFPNEGSKFYITSGSCNKTEGYIKIVNASEI